MDALVVIFLVGFLLYWIPNVILSAKLAQMKKPEKTCPPHKWEYRGHGEHSFMACAKCPMLPGMDLPEESEE